MAQFGVGPELAAQCPSIAPLIGYRPWTSVDGPIPDALAARAMAAAADLSVDLGATESFPLPGVIAVIRVEPHVWGPDTQGALVEGCFRAGGVYLPVGDAQQEISTPTSADSLSKTIAILTAVSLAVGTIATLASWRARR
jgi:hypothetical protein